MKISAFALFFVRASTRIVSNLGILYYNNKESVLGGDVKKTGTTRRIG